MKSINLLFLLFLFSTAPGKAQQRTELSPTPLSKAYYIQLSKKQKSQANLLVITGGATALIGGYIWFISPVAGLTGSSHGVESARNTGITLTAVGTTLAAFSIPLYTASKKNLKNAELYVGSNSFLYPSNGAKDILCIGARFSL